MLQPQVSSAPLQSTMTPGQVARLFGVSERTVLRWAHAGKLRPYFTPGGFRRFLEADVMEALVLDKPDHRRPSWR